MNKYSFKLFGINKHQDKKILMLVALRAFFILMVGVGIYFGLSYYYNQQDLRRLEEFQAAQQTMPYSLGGISHIYIPSLSIDAPLVTLGLKENGELETPANPKEVGWYKYGARPGEPGAAVLVGHLDSVHGPEIFYNLKNIKPGDGVEFYDNNGQKIIFIVNSVKSFSQDQFPTDLVYGPTEEPSLRLITCAGKFDFKKNTYSSNLVVFASLSEKPTD